MAGPRTLMTFFHSILISKRRRFRRFDEGQCRSFSSSAGNLFCASPLVLTLGDNHIGDLSLGRLRLSLSQGCTGRSRLNWKGNRHPSAPVTERGRQNQSEPIIVLKEKGDEPPFFCSYHHRQLKAFSHSCYNMADNTTFHRVSCKLFVKSWLAMTNHLIKFQLRKFFGTVYSLINIDGTLPAPLINKKCQWQFHNGRLRPCF